MSEGATGIGAANGLFTEAGGRGGNRCHPCGDPGGNVLIDTPINGSNQNIVPGFGRLGNHPFHFRQTRGFPCVLPGKVHHDQVLAPLESSDKTLNL